MISNNNNGSHTGHSLGSFKVDLGENADAAIAKQIGNSMVTNTNDNNKLYLDQAARDILYGETEQTEFEGNPSSVVKRTKAPSAKRYRPSSAPTEWRSVSGMCRPARNGWRLKDAREW